MIFFCLFLNVHVPVITDQFKHAIYLEHQYLVSLLIFTRTGPKQTETSNPALFIRHGGNSLDSCVTSNRDNRRLWSTKSRSREVLFQLQPEQLRLQQPQLDACQRARQSAFTPTGGRTIITAEGPERPSTGQGLQRTAAVTDTDIYSNDLSEGAKMKDKNRHKKYHRKYQTSKNKKEKKD